MLPKEDQVWVHMVGQLPNTWRTSRNPVFPLSLPLPRFCLSACSILTTNYLGTAKTQIHKIKQAQMPGSIASVLTLTQANLRILPSNLKLWRTDWKISRSKTKCSKDTVHLALISELLIKFHLTISQT